jgi:hypothetical protein
MNFQWTIPTMDTKSSRLKRFRLLILGALAVFLIWEVTTRGLASYLAESNPEASLRLRADNPTAVLNLIQTKLAEAQRKARKQSSQGDQSSSFYPAGLDATGAAQIRRWVEAVFRNDPLSSEALRVLGQLSDGTADKNQTRRLMQAAVRRSLRESIAVYYMMQDSYIRRDYGAALRYADVLLRTRPQVAAQVMPMLGALAENPDGNSKLKQLVATNPPWRGQFFVSLPSVITDARTPLDFLLSVRENGSTPPTTGELSPYINFLLDRGFYDLAYYAWLQFLPVEELTQAGHLFNGGFEFEPSGAPFDWRFSQDTGATTKVASRPGDVEKHALFMQFGPGRAEFQGVRQLLMLSPGSYILKGQYKLELISPRGLQWRISCVQATEPFAGSSLHNGRVPDWTNFDMEFTVPSQNCPAQTLELVSAARSASEQFMTGTAWYDDLLIGSAEPPQTSERSQ